MCQMVVGAVVCASLMSVAAAQDDAIQRERARLQGTWKAESAVGGGENLPADQLAKLSLTFKGEEIIPGDRPSDVAKYKLDPTQRPPAIDLTERNGKTSLGIYEMEGDTLRLCFSESGMPRPKEFESPKGSKIFLVVLKREKK